MPQATAAIAPGETLSQGIVSMAGGTHSVALSADGTAWVTGLNSSGQLGLGTTTARNNFIPAMNGVARVAGGYAATLFIKADRTLWVTGYNQGSAFGGPPFNNVSTPYQIATEVIDVASAQNHSVILKADGTVWTVGANFFGELGIGTTETGSPVFVQVASEAIAIAAGQDGTTLFIKADGTLWGMGNNGYGQLTGHYEGGYVLSPRWLATNVRQVAAGFGFTVYVKNDDTAWGIGYNASTQLGSFTGVVPKLILTGVRQVATGSDHTLLLKQDGTAWGVGHNGSGQVGNNSFSQVFNPVQVLTNVTSVAAGSQASLFLKHDGSLWAAGSNFSGALGDGTTTSRPTPVQVLSAPLSAPPSPATVAISNVAQGRLRVSCSFSLGANGYEFWRATTNNSAEAALVATTSLPLFFDNQATAGTTYYYWVRARNSAGSSAFTDGVSASSLPLSPYVISQPVSTQVAAGATAIFSVAVGANPTPTYQWQQRLPGGGWSDLTDGAEAQGTQTATLQLIGAGLERHLADYRSVATNSAGSITSQAATLRLTIAAARVASGVNHTLLLRQDGSLWATGTNAFGEHLDGTLISSISYTYAATGYVNFWTGSQASLALRQDGTLWSVGNDSGNLGGESYQRPLGQLAANVVSAALGRTDSFYLTKSGELYGFGYNLAGQLGLGHMNQVTTPTLISSEVSSVFVRSYHTLFIKADKTLWGAGGNEYFQLGDGTSAHRATPVLIAADVITAATGDDFSFFLKENGELWGMGSNSSGQLGLGYEVPRAITPKLITTGVKAIAAGKRTAYLVRSDGTLCRAGAYTDAGGFSVYSYTFEPITTSVHSVSAGENFAHWITTDGSVWGYQGNLHGQLGDGTLTARYTPTQILTGTALVPTAPQAVAVDASQAGLVRLTWEPVAGASEYVVLRSNSSDSAGAIVIASRVTAPLFFDATGAAGVETYYWVRAANPAGSTLSSPVSAVPVAGAPRIVRQPTDQLVAAGNSAAFDVGVVSNSPVDYRWQTRSSPSAAWADLGDNATTSGATTATLTLSNVAIGQHASAYRCIVTTSSGSVTSTVAMLRLPLAAVATSTGDSHTLVVRADGTLWAFGDNNYGQLGDGITTGTATPRFIRDSVVAASAGSSRTFFIDADANLWAVGANFYGSLGSGSESALATPQIVATNVAQVSAGNNSHAAFVKRDGTLWTMGGNFSSQLGNGDTNNTSTPGQIASDVTQVSAGGIHTLFIKADRTLWGVGGNGSGQLGDGTTIMRPTPVQVATDVAAVSAGNSYSLFIKSDGTLWAMGANWSRQLGDGTTTSRATPVQVATNVVACAAGSGTSHFIKQDGSVWAVGESGPLGTGSSASVITPVQVATNGFALSASSYHLSLLKTDGSVWTTGANPDGRLGDGTTINRLAFVSAISGIALPPETPAEFSAGELSPAHAMLTWKHSRGASRYELWRGTDTEISSATRLSAWTSQPIEYDATAAANTRYYYWVRAISPFALSDFAGPVEGFVVSTPAITSQPQSTAANTGESATFSVVATGLPQPTYQWYFEDSPLSGQTSSNLNLVNLTAGHAGEYKVVVSNSGGNVTSSAATLTVTPLVSFTNWLATHFTAMELDDPLLAGANADPDQDGLSNLVEYALGHSPRTATSTGLPGVSSASGSWLYTYQRPVDRTDVTYLVEFSPDLVNWNPVTAQKITTDAETETWTASTNQTTYPTGFFRLRITR